MVMAFPHETGCKVVKADSVLVNICLSTTCVVIMHVHAAM